MKRMIHTACFFTLLAASSAVHAVTVEHSTAIFLSFRDCVVVDTPCDSIQRTTQRTVDGLPGNKASQGSQQDPAYGTARASVRLGDSPGASEHHLNTVSTSGKRNGSTSNTVQKYTNHSDKPEILTFSGTLTFEQIVPDENTAILPESHGNSTASAGLLFARVDVDLIEAGTTAVENFSVLSEGPQDVEFAFVAEESISGTSNETGDGTKTATVTLELAPGESIWMWTVAQAIVANGAEVTTDFVTRLEVQGEGQ